MIFPAFEGGGAEAVCAWMMQALVERCDLTLVTFSEVDLRELDRRHGTALARHAVRVLVPFPRGVGRLLRGFSIRQQVMVRWFKARGCAFDVPISAMNEMDFGRPGIQYVHFPMFGHGAERVRALVGYPHSRTTRVYRGSLRWFASFSDERVRGNLTLVNSAWTAKAFETAYGQPARVVYPPVMSAFPEVSWDTREDGFVALSRMVAEKHLERAIEILARVRHEGFAVHLHVTAGQGDLACIEEIRRAQATHGPWLHLERALDRQGIAALVARHRYGIHTRENEHFGIAVAEMLKGGCLPFVPASGGQLEIIGPNPDLAFESDADAVRKICAVLRDRERQQVLRTRLRAQIPLFSETRFVAGIAQAFEDFVGRQPSRARGPDGDA